MTTFTIHTPESAPAESKAQLESAQRNYGRIPNLYGVLAEAPIAVGMRWIRSFIDRMG